MYLVQLNMQCFRLHTLTKRIVWIQKRLPKFTMKKFDYFVALNVTRVQVKHLCIAIFVSWNSNIGVYTNKKNVAKRPVTDKA